MPRLQKQEAYLLILEEVHRPFCIWQWIAYWQLFYAQSTIQYMYYNNLYNLWKYSDIFSFPTRIQCLNPGV